MYITIDVQFNLHLHVPRKPLKTPMVIREVELVIIGLNLKALDQLSYPSTLKIKNILFFNFQCIFLFKYHKYFI